jgi:hypothetical protein
MGLRVRSATTLACCGSIRRARSKVSVMGRCRGGSPEMIVLARYMLGLIAIAEAREA